MNDTGVATEDIAGPEECVSCGTPLVGQYCHACGERVVDPADLRVPVFARHLAAGTFDLDSRFWRTFRELFRRPGLLTAEFMRGRRRPYLHPLQTFLLANLLLFAVLGAFGGFSTFTTQLHFHVTGSPYDDIAQSLVERRGAPGTPEAIEYERRFDEATPRYANSMVILMVPLFAAVVALLHARRRRPFVEHLVLSLHFHAFLLILLTALPFVITALVRRIPATTAYINGETPVSILLLTVCTMYLAAMLRRAYEEGPVEAVVRALVAMLLYVPVLVVYRMILFFTVWLMPD